MFVCNDDHRHENMDQCLKHDVDRAADMTKQMWTGRMRVVQRGQEAAIMLVDR